MLHKYKTLFKQREYVTSLITGSVLWAGSLFVNYYAGIYATSKASNAVTDIVLSNIRVYDVDLLFVYGPLVFWIIIGILSFYEPKRLPFVLKSIALFILVRAFFINLTHIGPFPGHLVITSEITKDFTFGGDLFFSGHTGGVFLMALVFWQDIRLRLLFIAGSIFFGIIVLLAHLHYTIDVASAFFITYSIYRLAEIFFYKDKKLFSEE